MNKSPKESQPKGSQPKRSLFKVVKILLKVAIVLIVLLFLAGAGAFYWYQSNLNFHQEGNNEFVFTVTPSETLDTVFTKLQEQGFKMEKTVWQVYLKLNPSLGSGIQAGDFGLNSNMSIPDIIQALQKANIKKGIRITMQEGLRYDEVATILENGFASADPAKKVFSKAEFMNIVENPVLDNFSTDVKDFLSQNKPEGKNLEGFLFPDTYYFDESATALNVVDKLVNTLSMKLEAEDYQAIYGSNYSFHEILTVASLIERETLTVAERPLVADILYKRLEKGIDGVKMLQLCSTMLYIIKDWKADYKINEALKDQYKTNPYNTYRVAGLPPGPIANPGLVSIKAAIYPEVNEYYYFLHDANGVIHYAKNYSEHNANIKKYL
jgi:UPF0755 protein